ncbi:hypothetical protein N0V90_012873 [Kalmusia sp. IMI 367209]|nr:hypothetical protein N0V90_012873 [Kalmusia sp. IMI 367209]
MPNLASLYSRLPAAVTQAQVEATRGVDPDMAVKAVLLGISSKLLRVQGSTKLLGPRSTDYYSASLKTMHMRLEAGFPLPSPVQAYDYDKALDRAKEDLDLFLKEKKKKKTTTQIPAIQRPLEDYEDLYYAILATVKATHESLTLRLANGFIQPDAPLHRGSEHTIQTFLSWLLQQWNVINEPPLVRALDNAVRRSLVFTHLHAALVAQLEAGALSHRDAKELRALLNDPAICADLPGLLWIGGEHAGMISGRLNEKYRVLFQAEKAADDKAARWRTKKKNMRLVAAEEKRERERERDAARRKAERNERLRRDAGAHRALHDARASAHAHALHRMTSTATYAQRRDDSSGRVLDAHQRGDRRAEQALLPSRDARCRGEADSYALHNRREQASLTSYTGLPTPSESEPSSGGRTLASRGGSSSDAQSASTHSSVNSAWHAHSMEVRAHRVSQYTKWLRGSASQDARRFTAQGE